MDADNILRQDIASVDSWFLRFFVGGMIREMLALHTISSRVGSAWSAWWSRPGLYSFRINKLCLIKMKGLKLTWKVVHW
jgi:hypothetical protein